MPIRAIPSRRLRWVAATLLAALSLLGQGRPALAHTEFEGSNPANAATVAGDLAEVTLSFTNPAQLSGSGIQVFAADGTVIEPSALDTTDGTQFILRFDPRLAPGAYSVAWNVQAGDAHPISGTFAFTVAAAATLATTSTVPSKSTLAGAASTPPTTVHDMSQMDEQQAAAMAHAAHAAGSVPEALIGRAGRTLSIAGLLFGLGALVAMLRVIGHDRGDHDTVTAWIRLAGSVLAVGGLVELAAIDEQHTGSLSQLVQTKAGLAVVLRFVAGVIVFAGLIERGQRSSTVARPLSAAAQPTATAPTNLLVTGAGLSAGVASYWFDGHTVTRGPWLVHGIVNSVHLLAAAIWTGGVAVIALLVWRRRREGETTDAAGMVVRFSAIAGGALAGVAAAGVVMALFVLERPGDLTATEWGKALLIKLAGVVLAAAIGGYNHFRLRPALVADPQQPALLTVLRRTLAIEAALFVGIVVVTAWMVATVGCVESGQLDTAPSSTTRRSIFIPASQ
jgi:copper transport protein